MSIPGKITLGTVCGLAVIRTMSREIEKRLALLSPSTALSARHEQREHSSIAVSCLFDVFGTAVMAIAVSTCALFDVRWAGNMHATGGTGQSAIPDITAVKSSLY